MIDDYRCFRLGTLNGGDIEIEVNFAENEEVSNSKVLRLKIDGKKYDVPTKDLVSFLLLVGDVNVKKDLMPAKITRVRKLQRMFQYVFKASKDYKKGEEITGVFPYVDMHTDIEEALAGAMKNNKTAKKSIII